MSLVAAPGSGVQLQALLASGQRPGILDTLDHPTATSTLLVLERR